MKEAWLQKLANCCLQNKLDFRRMKKSVSTSETNGYEQPPHRIGKIYLKA